MNEWIKYCEAPGLVQGPGQGPVNGPGQGPQSQKKGPGVTL